MKIIKRGQEWSIKNIKCLRRPILDDLLLDHAEKSYPKKFVLMHGLAQINGIFKQKMLFKPEDYF